MKKTTFSKGCATALAAALVCTTVSLNPVEVFAAEKTINLSTVSATALDVRSYHSTVGDFVLDMDIPEIQTHKNATLIKNTNKQIKEVVDARLAEAQATFGEYKESFFATGGTEEDWAGRTMDVIVDYDVKCNQKDIFSMELTTAMDWISADTDQHFYNLDLKNKKVLTLEDVLGKDYVKICNDSINAQIKERTTYENVTYFSAEEGGFTTVTAETNFYLNSDGDVVVSFPKYEIAPGYMGVQEFVIQK